MAQPRPTRLREVHEPAPERARVIDAQFKVVKGRRSPWASAARWVLAFALAGVIGFLIPPIWVALQDIWRAG